MHVEVVDVSLTGIRVGHHEALPPVGTECTLRFESPSGSIGVDCTVMRSALHHFASEDGGSVYQSGLRINAARDNSDEVLRAMIAFFVERALGEQKANARGVPPPAWMMMTPAKISAYLRVERINGKWHRKKTKENEQPDHGFTISAAERDHNVALLCDAYDRTSNEGRRLIRILAELSISHAEGVPIRRYEP